MVSYKLSYLKCEEENEKLKKEVEKLRSYLDETYTELRDCMKKEEADKILEKVEEVSKMKVEEILKDENTRETLYDKITDIIDDIFNNIADQIAERIIEEITEKLDEIITKAIDKRKEKIRQRILETLKDIIYDRIFS
jgi:uncharacterized membrane-anchored protein YjiN (DUF445 family)